MPLLGHILEMNPLLTRKRSTTVQTCVLSTLVLYCFHLRLYRAKAV
jgi:hypothetical protein